MKSILRLPARMLALLLACAGPATSLAATPALTSASFAKVTPGQTKDQVREILGAPARAHQLRSEQRENWEYPYRGDFERRTFWVEFNADGTVRSTNDTKDFNSGPYRGP